jgi:hypothetical protein
MKRLLLALILILTIGGLMSIHDIDKQTGGRVAPQPNTNDDVQQRMAQGTNQVQNSVEGEDDRGLRTLERQILAVQDGTNKAVMGFYGEDNKFGLKVAKDGYDVLTAKPSDLIFNSENNVFKIVASGEASVTKPAADTSETVEVNLEEYSSYFESGSYPIALVYSESYGGVQLPVSYVETTGTDAGKASLLMRYEIDIQPHLFISVFTPNYSAGANPNYTNEININFKYYLLQETAN